MYQSCMDCLRFVQLRTCEKGETFNGKTRSPVKFAFTFHKELPLVCLVRGSLSSGLSSATIFFIRILSNFVIRLSTSCLSWLCRDPPPTLWWRNRPIPFL